MNITIKNPWWILNSAFVALLLVLLAIILLIRPSAPASTSLNAVLGEASTAATARRIDLSQIYRNDLFGTHIEQQELAETKEQKPEVVVPLPPPPQPAAIVQQQIPQFLPPLALSIKGIMYSNNELDNRAIIADTKSRREALYRLGDKLLDAEIIYIGNNKVMFIRSNGQQETLFVTAEDAQHDPIYRQRKLGEQVARKMSETDYILYPDIFKERITTMAQFLDSLDITTAWEQGKILGLRVGKLGFDSIAPSLGLQPADIVTAIDGIPLLNTENRTKVFHALTAADLGKVIEVKLLRSGQPISYRYTLQEKDEDFTQDLEQVSLARTFIPREIAQAIPAPQMQAQAPQALPEQTAAVGAPYFATEQPLTEPSQTEPQVAQSTTEQSSTEQSPVDLSSAVPQEQPKLGSIGNPLEQIQKRDRESMMAFGGRNAMLEPAQS